MVITVENLQKISGSQEVAKPMDWFIEDYLSLKVSYLQLKNKHFEQRYQMKFDEYEKQCLSKPTHDWKEEETIIEWDKTLALLSDYQQILKQWRQEHLK
jgi:hypothetical protein